MVKYGRLDLNLHGNIVNKSIKILGLGSDCAPLLLIVSIFVGLFGGLEIVENNEIC